MPQTEEEKSTIYDVAEHAGVAISTVSRVLNYSHDVAPGTRDRVLDTIRKLQFRPSRPAKSLAEESTRSLAVAVPTFTTPFHNELLKGVRDRLDDASVDFLLCDLDWEAPETTLESFLERGEMDGLILAGLPATEDPPDFLQIMGVPVVLIGAECETMDSFYWHDEHGARLAVSHLVERGHTCIGMITTPHDTHLRNARVTGYRQALEEAGLPFYEALVAHGETRKHDGFSEESGYEAMQRLLDLDHPITAVFASSDVQAIGAWQALRHEGYTVPDEYALVGYDDIKVSRFIGLSSVDQNMYYVGNRATDVALDRMEGSQPYEPRSQLVDLELKVRMSSDFSL